jgi:hypothetical protein
MLSLSESACQIGVFLRLLYSTGVTGELLAPPFNELSTGFNPITFGLDETGCGEVGWLFISLRH